MNDRVNQLETAEPARMEVQKELSEILFHLQEEVEGLPDGMDYRIYAATLWDMLGLSLEDPKYLEFEDALIRNMRKIPMADLVDPDALDEVGFPDFFKTFSGEVLLWCEGDTQDQFFKIARSRIRLLVLNAVRHIRIEQKNFEAKKKDDSQPQEYPEQKLHLADTCIIAQNKISQLYSFLYRKKIDHRQYSKIVVLDSSPEVFAQVQQVVDVLKLDTVVRPVLIDRTRVENVGIHQDGYAVIHRFGDFFIEEIAGTVQLKPESEEEEPLVDQLNKDTLWLVNFGAITDDRLMRQRQYAAKIAAIQACTPYKDEEDILAAILPNRETLL